MDCIFCKIVRQEIPSKKHHEDDLVIAFEDINPAADTHILIVPKDHIEKVSDMTEDQEKLMGHLLHAATKIAREKGLEGYKLQFNVGEKGGQIVMHIHLHLLGGQIRKVVV